MAQSTVATHVGGSRLFARSWGWPVPDRGRPGSAATGWAALGDDRPPRQQAYQKAKRCKAKATVPGVELAADPGEVVLDLSTLTARAAAPIALLGQALGHQSGSTSTSRG